MSKKWNRRRLAQRFKAADRKTRRLEKRNPFAAMLHRSRLDFFVSLHKGLKTMYEDVKASTRAPESKECDDPAGYCFMLPESELVKFREPNKMQMCFITHLDGFKPVGVIETDLGDAVHFKTLYARIKIEGENVKC